MTLEETEPRSLRRDADEAIGVSDIVLVIATGVLLGPNRAKRANRR